MDFLTWECSNSSSPVNLFRCFPYLWSLDLEYPDLKSPRTIYWTRRQSFPPEDGNSPAEWLKTKQGCWKTKTKQNPTPVTRIGPPVSKSDDHCSSLLLPTCIWGTLGKESRLPMFSESWQLTSAHVDSQIKTDLNMWIYSSQMHVTLISLLQIQTTAHAGEHVCWQDWEGAVRILLQDSYDFSNKKLGYHSSSKTEIFKSVRMTYIHFSGTNTIC